jgi:hypothetical protein
MGSSSAGTGIYRAARSVRPGTVKGACAANGSSARQTALLRQRAPPCSDGPPSLRAPCCGNTTAGTWRRSRCAAPARTRASTSGPVSGARDVSELPRMPAVELGRRRPHTSALPQASSPTRWARSRCPTTCTGARRPSARWKTSRSAAPRRACRSRSSAVRGGGRWPNVVMPFPSATQGAHAGASPPAPRRSLRHPEEGRREGQHGVRHHEG